MQPPQLVGKAQQGVDRVADEVGRGLVAGVQQEDAVLHQLVVAQPLAVDLAVDQRAQHIAVVGRPLAALGDEAVEIGRELGDRGIARRLALGAGDGFERAQDGERIAAEGRALARRHAQHVADHLDGQAEGEVLDQVHAALVGMLGQQPVDHRLDARLQAASARGVKAAARSLRTRVCSGGSLNTRLVV